MSKSFLVGLGFLCAVALGCSREAPAQPAVEATPAPVVAPVPAKTAAPLEIATPTPQPAAPPAEPSPTPPIAEAPAVQADIAAPPEAFAPPTDIYSGPHKLGVNRVTDMARIGSVTFSRRDGALFLKGRVARGKHWLELEGTVEAAGPKTFHLTGVIRGVPDMAWADQAPRERTTEARFTFDARKGRPYWRLYEVNGRDCVCDDGCGNDFCYIDIEQQPNPEATP